MEFLQYTNLDTNHTLNKKLVKIGDMGSMGSSQLVNRLVDHHAISDLLPYVRRPPVYWHCSHESI